MADKTKLAFDEIKEENIVAEEEDRRLCDRCIPGRHKIYRIAFYLCFTCSKYFCVECFRNHDANHNFVSKDRKQREIDGAYARIWNEGDIVETEKVSVCDRVDVKHELDRDTYHCAITGLCGLDNRTWAACDYSNFCIKIFQFGSNVLLRYLRIGSKPWDVTEIQVKQSSAVPDSASSSSSDISGTNRTKPDKQYLLAVTLPDERHILFIDINKNPAVRVKNVSMEKVCYEIEYSGDKIFTVCNEVPSLYNPLWSVYVMSTDGVKLSVIQTRVYRNMPNLAVLPGRVYLTDWSNSRVTCINVEGRVISQISMKWGWLGGISVDPDKNVYVGTVYPDNKVYKLDLDLTGPPRPLLNLNTVDMKRPQALCFYRDKLFASHGFRNNIVSVIRLV